MSLRLFVMSFAGVLSMGAVAVGAPSATDVIAPAPAEDLFASKPADPAPAVAPAPIPNAPPAADKTPATPPTQRVLSDNPLWAIPLRRLTNNREGLWQNLIKNWPLIFKITCFRKEILKLSGLFSKSLISQWGYFLFQEVNIRNYWLIPFQLTSVRIP